MQLEVTTSNETCTNSLRLATEPLTSTCQCHSPDISKRCEGAEKRILTQKKLSAKSTCPLITSDGFCNCNAAAFHNNGIKIVAVLETTEYRIINFKLAFKKNRGYLNAAVHH